MTRRPFDLDPEAAVIIEEMRKPAPVLDAPPHGSRFRLGWWWFWAGVGLSTLALIVAESIASTIYWIITQPLFGYPLAFLLAATLAAGLVMVLREIVAVRRLGSLPDHRADAARLLTSDLQGHSAPLIDPVLARIDDRPALVARFREHDHDALTDGERLKLFERTVVIGMDEQAYRAVVRGSRDIGVLTALSPLGLLDAALVLWRTMAMLRDVARAYGLPLGAVASAMLLRRAVRNMLIAGLADLVTHGAANAVGGGFFRLLSAKAGQGATNAMLAARMGCEAMTVVRPLPFVLAERPNLKRLAGRILAPAETADTTVPVKVEERS
ncbi:MAG: TIGR01620 family protein [Pseudomonadota bacterium]